MYFLWTTYDQRYMRQSGNGEFRLSAQLSGSSTSRIPLLARLAPSAGGDVFLDIYARLKLDAADV